MPTFSGSVNPFLLSSFIFIAVLEIAKETVELKKLKALICTPFNRDFFSFVEICILINFNRWEGTSVP